MLLLFYQDGLPGIRTWISNYIHSCDFNCVNFKHNLGNDILSIQVNITQK